MVTHPTVIVGTGQAGIRVMSRIHEIAQKNNDSDKFKYIAVDTDKDTLKVAPTGASKITLDLDQAFLQEDLSKYPYLLENMDIKGSGAKRQRPVGRYKVDRRGDGGYEEVFSTLSEEISSHYQEIDVQLSPDTASFNIFFIHSFGGGTGSGTYPLILSILHNIAQDEIDATDEVVYLSGVGAVPEIPFDPEVTTPPGDTQDYYPNANAALRDLREFTGLSDGEDPLELNIWSRTLGQADYGRSSGNDFNTFEFSNVPFEDYWLVGVHEDKIGGSSAGRAGPESYAAELNQTIARSIHAVSKLDMSAENWSMGTSHTGAFAQAEITVPHEQVELFVEQKQERQDKQTRIEEIPEDIEELEARQGELEELKRNLDPADLIDEGDDLEGSVERFLEQEGFRGGGYIVENKSAEQINATLDKVEGQFSIEGTVVATELIQQAIQEERGAPAVEEDWQNTIQRLWTKYDLQAESEYGGGSVRTLEGKASVAEEYLQDKIAEFAEIKDEWDPSTLERLQDWAPPIAGPLESEREYADKWLEALQDDYSDLERVMGSWGRVSKMLEAIEQQRTDIRSQIDEQIGEITNQITELHNERDELRKELRKLENDIDSLRDTLTREKVNERIAVLPLKEDRVDEIDDVVLNRLTSLAAYVDEGYVSEEKLRYALNHRLEFCKSWEESIIQRDFSETDETERFQPQNEIWYLFHEDNRDFQNYIEETPDAEEEFSGEKGQSKLHFLENPYRIEYVSYTRRGPVSALEVYQSFEELDADGWLRKYANQYEDYRHAFAYPEWYGREIKEAFGVRAQIELPTPPELTLDMIEKPGMEEGELKNYVKNVGLDSYLWQGNMWDAYRTGAAEKTFRGWKRDLTKHEISYTDIQRATPEARKKSEWLANQRDWNDLLRAYQENLIKQKETKIVFEGEDD